MVGGETRGGILGGGRGDEAAEQDRGEEGEEKHGKCDFDGYWWIFFFLAVEGLVVEEALVVMEIGRRRWIWRGLSID